MANHNYQTVSNLRAFGNNVSINITEFHRLYLIDTQLTRSCLAPGEKKNKKTGIRKSKGLRVVYISPRRFVSRKFSLLGNPMLPVYKGVFERYNVDFFSLLSYEVEYRNGRKVVVGCRFVAVWPSSTGWRKKRMKKRVINLALPLPLEI